MSDLATFDGHLRQCAHAACTEWGYPPPDVDWLESVHARLPVGLRTEVGRAVASGVVDADGHRFTVDGAGPIDWFEPGAVHQLLPAWRRFIQVAEYTRVRSMVAGSDLRIGFDEAPMDITVRRGDDLLWWIDAEESFPELYELSRHLDRFGSAGVDHDADDRDDDALRKAKALVELRPAYLSLVGIGGRLDFSIAVHDIHHFDLIPDLVPVGT